MAAGAFTIISDGASTWQKSGLTNGGKWGKAQSIDMAIAAFTGVAQNAATTIPTALLNRMGGVRFGLSSVGKVSRLALNRGAAYRVDGQSVLGGMSLWIDGKSFLLVKKTVHSDMSKFKMPEGFKPPANMPAMPNSGTTDVTETFSEVRVNEAIPASTFARPAGAPK